METVETRKKLADGIRQLQSSGQSASVPQLVSAYKAKYQSQATTPVAEQPIETKGTLLSPLKEGIDGLKTLYGGGEQGIANKLKQDIQAGAKDIQEGNIVKGVLKSGLRTAGDVAGAIYAPVGALLQATGINKVFDYLGELSQKGGNYNPINLITDSKKVQDFVMARPNLEEDFSRALNLAFSKGETGKIDPKTIIDRTIAQVESGVTKTVQKTKSITGRLPEDIINKRVSELENISDNYAQLRKETNFNPERAKESVRRVAETDVLTSAVDENGLIRTKQEGGAVDQYKTQTLDNAENLVRRNLERLNERVNLDEVQIRLSDAVNRSGLQGADLKVALNKIKKEISGYKLRADSTGNVPLTLIHDAKIATTKKVRDFTTPSEVKTYEKAIGEGLKEIVEKNSTFNVKEVNAELSKYLQDIKFLEQLDGKKVKGGKLSKYFAQISGNIVGGAVGGAVGGPIGSALGTLAGGELAGRIKGSMLERSLGGKTGGVQLKNPVIQKALNRVEGNDISYRINNSQSNNLGSRNAQYQTPSAISKNVPINQNNKAVSNKAPITKTSNRIISESIPQKKGIIQRVVDKYKSIPNKQGGFINFGAKITKAIDDATKRELQKAIDYIDFERSNGVNQNMEEMIGLLAEKFGVTSKNYRTVANQFEKLIEKTKTIEKPRAVASVSKATEQPRTTQGRFDTKTNPLLQEAKRYKSAEEFVKKQTPISHYTAQKFDKFDLDKTEAGSVWFTDNSKIDLKSGQGLGSAQVGTGGAKYKMDRYINPKAKIIDIEKSDLTDKYTTGQLIDMGYSGIKVPQLDGSNWYEIFNPDTDLLTKSQLTDIWNKAQGKK